jgi:excinuclease ABC subunit C
MKDAPSTIGVYIFWSGKERVYVGKSINLKARLISHFEAAKLDKKERAIIESADRIETFTANSEFGALVLEASLIKKYLPRYNRVARDDKSYLYITANSTEDFPAIQMNRARDLRNAPTTLKIIGPFPSQKVVAGILQEIRRVIPYATHGLQKKPCFYHKIGLCEPCPGTLQELSPTTIAVAKKKYRKNIRRIISVLSGNTEPVLEDLRKELKQKIKDENDYEDALLLRDRILRFEHFLSQKTGLEHENFVGGRRDSLMESLHALLQRYFPNLPALHRLECYDVSNLSQKNATCAMTVMEDGAINKREYRKFRIKSTTAQSDFEMLTEVMHRRFNSEKHGDWQHPDVLIVDGGKPQVRTILRTLAQMKIEIPVIGIAKAPDRLVMGTSDLPMVRPPLSHSGFNAVRLLRDEAHRFSKKYHLLLRNPLGKHKGK